MELPSNRASGGGGGTTQLHDLGMKATLIAGAVTSDISPGAAQWLLGLGPQSARSGRPPTRKGRCHQSKEAKTGGMVLSRQTG